MIKAFSCLVNRVSRPEKEEEKLRTTLGFGGSVGVGGRSRGRRGAAAEVVNDATKLTPGRLPTKHEAVPAARGRGNLKPYEHRFDLVDTRGTSDYMLPAGDGRENSCSGHRLQQSQLLRLHLSVGLRTRGSSPAASCSAETMAQTSIKYWLLAICETGLRVHLKFTESDYKLCLIAEILYNLNSMFKDPKKKVDRT
jgi:hypothetical protein